MKPELVPALITKIKAQIPSLTKAEQRVAVYITKNPQDVIFQSISELADCSKTSEATVVRACKSLGFSSYQEFKVLLAQAIANPDQVLYGAIRIEDNAPVSTIVDSVFESTVQTLRLTQSALDVHTVEQAAELLCHAKRVFILGLGGSHAIAIDLQHKLLRLGIDAVYHPDLHMQRISIANQISPDDVLFAISHSGSSKDVVDNAAIAKKMNAKIIALTGALKSPLSSYADVQLYTLSDETKHSIASVSSRLAQLAVIDVLHTIISNRDKEAVAARLENVYAQMASLKY